MANEANNNTITKEWMNQYDAGLKGVLAPLADAPVAIDVSSAPTSSTLTYTVGSGQDAKTYAFKVGDEVRVADAENASEGANGYVYYKLYDLVTENGTTTAYWDLGGSGGSGGGALGKVRVYLKDVINDVENLSPSFAGVVVTLTNTTDNDTPVTKTLAAGESSVVFRNVTPLKNYSVSVAQLDAQHTTPQAQTITNLAIGEEKELTFAYEADEYTVNIASNQGTDAAISSAKVTYNNVQYGDGEKFKVAKGTTVSPTASDMSDVTDYAKSISLSGKTINALYSTTLVAVSVVSNQSDFAERKAYTINGQQKYVTATGTTPATTGTVKVPTGSALTITAPDIEHYAKSVSSYGNATGASQTIEVTYSATKVNLQMVGVESGVEGNFPTGAQGTVKHTGGADQTLTDNTATALVPTGSAFTIEYADVQNYSTPATYSGTAAGTSMTATKAQYIYGVLNVDVTMSDNDNTDLALVTANIIVNGGSATAMQGTIDTTNHKMTFQTNLDAGDTYEVTFGTVQGYATPAAMTGTKGSGVETVTAEYETDIYTLSVTGQNRSETIEYVQGGQTVSNSVDSGNSIKVPTGTTPTVASAYVKGYARSVTIGTVTAHAATITVAYTTTVHTVVMMSNQTGDAVISALQATVAWTYDGHSESETLDSGDTVNVPTGVTPTITFPDATGYTKTVTDNGTTHTAAYTTEIVTVALASDTGQADLSGVTITVTDTTASAAVSPFATRQYKIPGGHAYQVSVSDNVEGYAAPAAVTGTAGSGTDAAQTVTMTYEEQAGFVDLELPSGKKWAVGNLVKDSQGNYSIGEKTDQGTYVSWGNIIGHNEGEGYNFYQTTYDSTPGKQVAANIPSNDAAHDIALATLGTPWHLPTKEDFQELYDNTDSEWVADYNGTGVAGRKFMKKTNHSIYVFFPASGIYSGTSLNARGSDGYYWSSSFGSATVAYNLNFRSSSVNPQDGNSRRYGFTVRPVQ